MFDSDVNLLFSFSLAAPCQKLLSRVVVESDVGFTSVWEKGMMLCSRRGKIPLLILFYFVLKISAAVEIKHTRVGFTVSSNCA
jgi:hypothetical protein